jgi:O-antigen/teichoic acid export membrane protein
VAAASGLFAHLDVVAGNAWYAALFVAATLTGTAGVVLDQTSTAQRRGDMALVRGIVFGATAITALCVIHAFGGDGSAAIFAPWLAGGTLMLALGLVQFRRLQPGYRTRPVTDRALLRALVAVGIRNQLLTLAERAPQLLLPILVTELLSPHDNAAWYVAWMTAWVVFIIPVQVGMTMFADAAREPERIDAVIRRGLRLSLGIGIPAALVVAALAGPLLPLLGDTYAADGTAPLRVLVIAVIPLSFTYAYYSACRAIGRLGPGTVAAWIVAAVGVAAAAAAGTDGGLTAIAVAWVGVQFGAAAWFGWRLRCLMRTMRAAHP